MYGGTGVSTVQCPVKTKGGRGVQEKICIFKIFILFLTGLELSVEATYPIDESIGTALIFLSGQVT